MTAKITATTTATWSFAPTTMTVNGRTFGASYSVARGGDVYVFTGVQAAPGAQRIPVRMHITQDMPMHADALAAAKLAAEAEAPQAEPAPVQDAPKPAKAPKAAKPKAKPAPVEASKAQAPAPVQDAPKAQTPAPVQEAPKPAKPAKAPKAAKPKPAPVEAPKAQAPAPVQADAKPAKAPKAPKAAKPKAKPAPVEAPKAQAPAPVQDAAQAVCKPAADAAQAVCKAWIGSTITGKGWRIVFDGDAQRTRVIFDAKPTAAQAAAVDAARFYYSPSMGSYNKHLTCKAYKAAQALAQTLAGLAA